MSKAAADKGAEPEARGHTCRWRFAGAPANTTACPLLAAHGVPSGSGPAITPVIAAPATRRGNRGQARCACRGPAAVRWSQPAGCETPFEGDWGHGIGGERTTTSPPRECRVPRAKKPTPNPYKVGVDPRARARAGSAENTKTPFLGSQGIKKPALPVIDKAGGFAV